MMRRVTWFVGGALTGVVTTTVAKRKVKQVATQLTPARIVHGFTDRVSDAVAEGRRAMRTREFELRGRLDANTTTLADRIAADETILVRGSPVEPGQVIVLKQIRERGRRRL